MGSGAACARSPGPNPSDPQVGDSTPAHFEAFVRSSRGQALDGLVRDELDPRVEEVEARRLLGLLAGLGEFNDGLDALRCHQQSIV